MNWQTIIKPGDLDSKSHPQYPQKAQNSTQGGNFEDSGDIKDRIFPVKRQNGDEKEQYLSSSIIIQKDEKLESDKKHFSTLPPLACLRCLRVETIDIQGQAVHGCLYTAEGDYPDGWRRLPEELTKCMWSGGRQWN